MNWDALVLEYILLTGLLVNIVVCAVKDKSELCYNVFLGTIIAGGMGLFLQKPEAVISGLVLSAPLANLQVFLLLGALAICLLGKKHMLDAQYRPSNILLLHTSLIGVLVLVASSNLLTIYLGIELMSLPLYTMVAIRSWDEKSLEGALKYFVTGAIASAFLLLGFALLYATTGQLDLKLIADAHASSAPAGLFVGPFAQLLGGFSIAFMMAGFAFKLGLFPFHSWLPDVYESAREDVVLWIATLPKVAVGLALIKLMIATQSLAVFWQPILLLSGLLSVGFGNLLALRQDNYRRLLAYSSIAHMGFFALALYAMSELGYSAGVFYLLIYLTMSLTALGWLSGLRDSQQLTISELQGIGLAMPLLGGVLLMTVFSLAGVPPLAGFMSKLTVFSAIVAHGDVSSAVLAVLLSVIALGYYLNLIKVMFFTTDKPTTALALNMSKANKLVLMLSSGLLLVGGLVPNTVLMMVTDLVKSSALIG